jgi:hypothetical protein
MFFNHQTNICESHHIPVKFYAVEKPIFLNCGITGKKKSCNLNTDEEPFLNRIQLFKSFTDCGIAEVIL